MRRKYHGEIYACFVCVVCQCERNVKEKQGENISDNEQVSEKRAVALLGGKLLKRKHVHFVCSVNENNYILAR